MEESSLSKSRAGRLDAPPCGREASHLARQTLVGAQEMSVLEG